MYSSSQYIDTILRPNIDLKEIYKTFGINFKFGSWIPDELQLGTSDITTSYSSY